MKVVLIDDHALFRVGIRHVLAMSAEFELVGEAATARDGFKLIEATVPDVVIMDISLPGMDGVLATRELKRRAPLARVLIVTAHSEIHDVLDAMSAGAVGYALKSDGPEILLEALQQVARGQRYVAPAVATRLSTLEAKRRRATHVLGVLSEREREIFRLAAKCLIAREIATELCIARKTVDTHLNRINHKLGLRNQAELVRLAANLGMIDSGRQVEPEPEPAPRPPTVER